MRGGYDDDDDDDGEDGEEKTFWRRERSNDPHHLHENAAEGPMMIGSVRGSRIDGVSMDPDDDDDWKTLKKAIKFATLDRRAKVGLCSSLRGRIQDHSRVADDDRRLRDERWYRIVFSILLTSFGIRMIINKDAADLGTNYNNFSGLLFNQITEYDH